MILGQAEIRSLKCSDLYILEILQDPQSLIQTLGKALFFLDS